jgi:hypothetical protein
MAVVQGKVIKAPAETFQGARIGRMERKDLDVVGEGVVLRRAEEASLSENDPQRRAPVGIGALEFVFLADDAPDQGLRPVDVAFQVQDRLNQMAVVVPVGGDLPPPVCGAQ